MVIYSSVDMLLKGGLVDQKCILMYKGVPFPLALNFKSMKKTVVFLPGAFDRRLDMPKFQRYSYFDDLECNGIATFDPTLFLKDYLPIGWFQGTESQFYVTLLQEILATIFEKLNLNNEDILFFSTSSGGIPALKIAQSFPGCHVYGGNIQTNIFLYKEANYNMLMWAIINKTAPDLYKNQFPDRYHVYGLDGAFNFYYAQNMEDNFHYTNHYEPFIESISKSFDLSVETVLYSHKASGHDPISKDIEIKIINSIFNENSIKKVFSPFV